MTRLQFRGSSAKLTCNLASAVAAEKLGINLVTEIKKSDKLVYRSRKQALRWLTLMLADNYADVTQQEVASEMKQYSTKQLYEEVQAVFDRR
ncbi:hypothetical protein [Enterococcus songbeiensis]|uniref:hypothetical protein n=1 Tax=Enterococcus songbeiensis TaxID=2559927 RepID=UPI0010F99492|nr:hypothetical protein [Enterococcus songbeiensis]